MVRPVAVVDASLLGLQMIRYQDREDKSGYKEADPEALGKESAEWYTFFKGALQSRHTEAKNMWRLYLNQLQDNRKQYEQWRSMVHSPHHSSAVEVAITGAVNMLYPGGRSPIRPEAVPGAGEEVLASKLEQWFDYVIRMNRSKRETELELREIIVQSLCVRKNIFIERVRYGTHEATNEEFANHSLAIEEAINKLGQVPPLPEKFADPKDFEEAMLGFRKVARAAGVDIPPMPQSGKIRTVLYRGPHKKRVSFFNFFFDLGEPLQEQTRVMQKHYLSKQWILDRTGPEDDKPFDPELVEQYLKAIGERAGQEELDLRQIFGTDSGAAGSPKFKDMVLALEAYHLDSPHPYRFAIMSGDSGSGCCINKNYDNPFEHGGHPYTLMGGIELPFVSCSLSELYQIEPLIKEGNTLRGLRLDGVKGAVLPVFARLKTSNLGELANRYSPGLIHDSPVGAKGLQQVSTIMVPEAAFREGREIQEEIDEQMGTHANTRGQVAPPRTTAQGIERANTNATTRAESRVVRWEEDNQSTIDQWLSLAHQYYDEDDLKELGGVISRNPLVEFDRKDFIAAINMKYAFRAASSAINKDIQNQALQNIFTLGVNAQVPRLKIDKLFERIVKNVDEHAAAEAFFSEEEWQQLQAQQQQVAAEQPQPQQQQPQPGQQEQGQ